MFLDISVLPGTYLHGLVRHVRLKSPNIPANKSIKKSNQNSFYKNTEISTYTVILKLNKSKTPFIILAQIIV